MSRTVDERHRSALLDKLVDYVLEQGLADLALRPLGKAVAVSPRTLLYYFGSKEALLVEVLARARARQQAGFANLKLDETLARDRLCRAIWAMLSAPESESAFRLFFEVYGLALQDRARFPNFLDAAIVDWLAFLEAPALREGQSPQAARASATLTLAVFRGLLLDLVATRNRARIDDAFETWLASLRYAHAPSAQKDSLDGPA